MYITYAETKDLMNFFGSPDEKDSDAEDMSVSLELMNGHSGHGLYAYYTEYPDEGIMLLGKGRNR